MKEDDTEKTSAYTTWQLDRRTKGFMVGWVLSMMAFAVGLSFAMGLPWWGTMIVVCICGFGFGLGMFLALKVIKQMRDWDPKK